MNTQINTITLGVGDLARAKEFYEGLGCSIEKDQGGFVSLTVGDRPGALALYHRDALADDAGQPSEGGGFGGFTLSLIFDTAERVDEVLAAARRAGGTITQPAKTHLWGGYSGYFDDPDGYHWKVASTSKPARRARRQSTGPASVTLDPKEIAVVLGVEDINRSKQFYADGLGCPVDKAYSKYVGFALGDDSSSLALYRREALAKDAAVAPEGHGFRGFTLSNIVDTADGVDEVLAAAERAGGRIVKLAEDAPWGGYSGYFADPDGNLWKIVANG